MIYADHESIFTDARSFSSEWVDLFEERQEMACRKYGGGAAFVVEATHVDSRFYERKPGDGRAWLRYEQSSK